MGFIRLEEDDRFDFPDDKAGLSVFHQLHCLVRTHTLPNLLLMMLTK